MNEIPIVSEKYKVDLSIREIKSKIVVLAFIKDESDLETMQLIRILNKCQQVLSKMATIVLVKPIEIYLKYFEITLFPSTVFFFNGIHMKVDYGSQDHTKFVGAFVEKQDFIDLVEALYKGAVRGKSIINSPIPKHRIPKYDILYKGF